MEVAIVTDSTADLPLDRLQEQQIRVIPLNVSVGGEEYLDQIELSTNSFLDKLAANDKMPTTSQPPLGKFVDLYEELAKDYDYILSLHISGGLSGTVKTAQTASNMVSGAEIKVVDSKLVTVALGVVVEKAAKAAREGQSLEEILALVEDLKEQVKLYFTVEELDYLEKGGRIGKAAAFLGNLFKIRPLLTLDDGEVDSYQKIRGKKRLYNAFIDLAAKLRTTGSNKLIILYGRKEEQAEILKDKLTTEYNWDSVEMHQFGAVVGAHVGPTPFGMVIC